MKNKNYKITEITKIQIHDFKHSCASLLISSDVSIILVAKYLGYTKINETLNIYSHMYQNKLENIVNLTNKSTIQTTSDIKNSIDVNLDNSIDNSKDDMEISL